MVIATRPNDIKERLSLAYLTAVAARAGCQIRTFDLDRQSIDVTVRPVTVAVRIPDTQRFDVAALWKMLDDAFLLTRLAEHPG